MTLYSYTFFFFLFNTLTVSNRPRTELKILIRDWVAGDFEGKIYFVSVPYSISFTYFYIDVYV